MRYFKILFSTILLFGFVYTAEAQVIVTSTTAASEHSKSIRQKGLVIRPEIGVGLFIGCYVGNVGHDAFSSHLLCDIDYQFNPYISLGGGIGLNLTTYNNLFSIPLFAHLRGYFCNRKWSPYYDIKIGYNFLNSGSSQSISPQWKDTRMYDNMRLTGFYGNFGLGMQYKNFDFGIDMSLNRMDFFEHIYFPYNYEVISENKPIVPTIYLKFAYNFQIQKKKK